MRKVNIRFFVTLVASVVIAVVGLFIVHYFQEGRVQAALLWQANRAEEEGQSEKVAHYLGQYLEFAPDDLTERIRLGETLASDGMRAVPKSRDRAIYVLEGVLARDPKRNDIRCTLARVAMEARRYDLAREHLDIVRKSGEHAAELAYLMGLWHEGQEQFADAADDYAQAIAGDLHRIEAYTRRAYVLRGRLGKPDDADKVMDDLVAQNGKDCKARLERWHYRAAFGLIVNSESLTEAGQDLEQALKLDEKNSDVLLAVGEWHWRNGKVKEADRILQKGLALYSEDPRFYLGLSQLDNPPPGERGEQSAKNSREKKPDTQAAEQWLRKGLEAVPTAKHKEMLFNLATLMLNRGDFTPKEDAEFSDLLKRISTAYPNSGPADYLRGRYAVNQGQYTQAVQLFERARPMLMGPPDLVNQVNLYLAQCFDHLEDPIQKRIALSRVKTKDAFFGTSLKGADAARLALAREMVLESLRDESKDPKQAELALLQLEKMQPDSPEPTLLRVEMLAVREKFIEARELLDKKLAEQPRQIDYYLALAALCRRQGRWDEFEKQLVKGQEQCGEDIRWRLARIAAVAERHQADAGRQLAFLARAPEESKPGDQALLLRGLAEAYTVLGKTREAAEYWNLLADHPRFRGDSRIPLILFEMARQAGDRHGMTTQLERLAKIEGKDGVIYGYAVGAQALFMAKQGEKPDLDEAHRLLSRAVENRPQWPAGLLALAELEDLRGNRAEAATYYQKAFKLSAYNPLMLGQALAEGGQKPEDVERNLERAAIAAQNVPEAWVAYIQYVARRDRPRAEKTIEQIKDKLPDSVKAQALSLCYEAVGNLKEAEIHYEAALKQDPQNAPVVRAVANFYLRTGHLDQAEKLIRLFLDNQIKATPADTAWAKSGLALVMVARQDYRKLGEAAKLVGLSVDAKGNLIEAKNADDSVEGLRARARVLSTQSGKPPRDRAIALLVKLADRQALTPDDQFLLAQLYEMNGQWPHAREQMTRLLERAPDFPPYLEHSISSLLRAGDVDEAEKLALRLEELDKKLRQPIDSPGHVILKAQILEARNKGDQALALLRKFTQRPGANPDEVFLIIQSLARQKRIEEALALCDQMWDKLPPVLASGASVSLLREAKGNEERSRRVEERLRKAIQANPAQAGRLRLHLADLLTLRGQYLQAEKEYRIVLDQDADNLMALNNLAWLLSQRESGKEALQLINHALELAGPQSDLLDTRSLAFLALKQTDNAVADLEQAIHEGSSPIQFFHLARAHQQAHNEEASQVALAEAKKHGLTRSALHPAEAKVSGSLVDQLSP